MQPRGTTLSGETPGEVGIREQMRLQRTWRVPDPTYQPIVVGGINIADQTVEPSVALGRPFREEARQVGDCL